MEGDGEERQHILRDGFMETNPFTKTDDPVPSNYGIIKDKYGYET